MEIVVKYIPSKNQLAGFLKKQLDAKQFS